MCNIGVTKGKIEKRRQNELKHLYFHLHNTRRTQNLKTLAPLGTEKSATEIFIGEKEK